MRISKTPSHVGNVAMISAGRADHVGALTRSVAVVRSQNRSSESVSPGLGVQLLANGIDVVVLGIAVAGSVGLAVFTVLGGQIHAIEQTLARAVEMRQSSCEAGSGKEQLGCGELHFCWQKLGYRVLSFSRCGSFNAVVQVKVNVKLVGRAQRFIKQATSFSRTTIHASAASAARHVCTFGVQGWPSLSSRCMGGRRRKTLV